jgi:hypothetical protein
VTDPERPGPVVRPYLRNPARDRRPAKARRTEVAQQPGLRPFVLTSGRVVTDDPDIGMETQVTAHPGAAPVGLPPESRAIISLCAQPLSVAEISAKLRLHLGVTRVLVGDLRAAGQLDVHVLRHDFPDPDTIRRVIRGLRAID